MQKMKTKHFVIKSTALAAAVACALAAQAQTPTPPALSQMPLTLSSGAKPNVLAILDTSQSMEEEPVSFQSSTSAYPESKSWIARSTLSKIANTYVDRINLGLMIYNTTDWKEIFIQYGHGDVSYNPATYNPSWTGDIFSATNKKYRQENPADPGNFIHYNAAQGVYGLGRQGTGNVYCYSPDKVKYSCFRTKMGTSDVIPPLINDGVVPPDGFVPDAAKLAAAAAAGYTGYLSDNTFTCTDGCGQIGLTNRWVWFDKGPDYNGKATGLGYLLEPIKPLDTTQLAKIEERLKCNVPGNQAPCSPTGTRNGGSTPIEGTLMSAKNYFTNALTAIEGLDASGPSYPLPESCARNYAVLLTDGLPNVRYHGGFAPTADAMRFVAREARNLRAAGVPTYVIGFGLPYGEDPTNLDTIASNGGTGVAFNANDGDALKRVFDSVFSEIMVRSASASAVASNSTSLNQNNRIYQATFSSADWSGRLMSLTVNADGTVSAVPNWDAADVLDRQGARRIITWDGGNTGNGSGSGSGGIPFQWNVIKDISSIKGQLDQVNGVTDNRSEDRVAWLRGDRSKEGTTAATLRKRSTLLGSIINSSPRYVGAPASGYPTADYATFVSTYASRTPMVYVGASDGMLHGFKADTGEEAFAYVPNKLVNRLSSLTSQSYTHRYMVDGSPITADAYVKGQWRTMLVGGLGAGGRGVYALDVTNPANFTEAKAGTLAAWEFTDKDDKELGYTIGEPRIVKLNNGKWAAIVGNGLNNTDSSPTGTGKPSIFILLLDRDPGNGKWSLNTDYYRIDTNGAGTPVAPSGIVNVAAVDDDRNGTVDYVYGGDLNGNLWKFDLTSATAANWKLGNSNLPVFQAKASDGTLQPITTGTIEVVKHPDGGRLILFGTGKYLWSSDANDVQVQSFYGIRDKDAGGTVKRSELQAQTIQAETFSSNNDWRLTSQNSVDYTVKKGWYIDLKLGAAKGERVVYKPQVRGTHIVFVTLEPGTVGCTSAGSTWLMELDVYTGARLQSSPFDVNADRRFGSGDLVKFGASFPAPSVVSGRKSTIGITAHPTVISDTSTTNQEYKIMSGSKGTTESVREYNNVKNGRITWRDMSQ